MVPTSIGVSVVSSAVSDDAIAHRSTRVHSDRARQLVKFDGSSQRLQLPINRSSHDRRILVGSFSRRERGSEYEHHSPGD